MTYERNWQIDPATLMLSHLSRHEATRPWLAIKTQSLPVLPAMLGHEERQFLYWVGQQSTGKPIVDLGTFLGASAASLAAGARSSGSLSRVFSYDLFTYGSWCAPFDMGAGWTAGDDTLPFVKRELDPWGDSICLIKGDISDHLWTGDEIDTLFVDFTQNWWHHNHVCRAFLPHLRLGGILAHQDYVYVLCYWLHIFMEHYAAHFEPISYHIDLATAAWRYVSALPAEAHSRGLNELLTVSEMLTLLDRSLQRYANPWRGLLRIARTRFLWHARGSDAALESLNLLEADYARTPDLRPHLDLLANEIRMWPRAREVYDHFFRET